MTFDINTDAVIGKIQVADSKINDMILTNKINKLSIEQIATKGEDCDNKKCIQKGVTFTGLALLTSDVEAGDPSTEIKAESCQCEKQNSSQNSSFNSEILSDKSMTKENSSVDTAVVDTTIATKADEIPTTIPTTNPTTSTQNIIGLSEEQFNYLKTTNSKLIDEFTKALANFKATEKKEESIIPSSKVVESATVESFKIVHEFLNGVKNGIGQNSTQWQINLDEQYKTWGYEAVTISAGDAPQLFSNRIIVTPDGKTKVPIRQYCQVTTLNGAEKANWYKIGAVSFGAITEGTEPTNVSHTLTKITATPAIRGGVQRIGFSQIEDVPALTNAVNESFVLEAIADEEKLLHTEFDSVSPSNWVNANTGATISSSDDVSGMTFKGKAIVNSLVKLQNQGYDTSAGNCVLVLHPKAFGELLVDSDISSFYQNGNPSITATGALAQIYGVQIIVSPQVKAKTNTTNHTYRNLLFVKGAFGIATARDMTMEAQRRNEVQQVVVSGTQRIAVKTLDEKMVVRISSAQ